ncbi:MAG: ABC transporter ATP-binding protein [Chloroflexota bacterium]
MENSTESVIQVRDLVKRFGSVTAVDGISFDVCRGEIFGILGPNGAGKTTTLETIEGLLSPTSGAILVLGVETHRHPERVKERIGIQLQASAYFDYLTLREILALFGGFYPRHIDPDELLARVGLTDKRDTTLAKLSGGQKQRFTIAASLVNDPELVILDEPTTGLDPQARRHLWEFIQEIHGGGKTVVLTTHYMEEAQFLCHRVAIMDMGKIVALDTPMNLIRGLEAPYQIKLEASAPLDVSGLQGLEGVKGAISSDGARYALRASDASRVVPALLQLASSQGAAVAHLEVVPATLEDVFLALTGKQLRD